MRQLTLFFVVAIRCLPVAAQPGADELHRIDPPPFDLSDGLVAEVAAAPPLVRHPVKAVFDERGRLFVIENAGQDSSGEDLEEKRPNAIRLLEDSNGDGRFDKATVFADGMALPRGALWLMDALYVMSPPSLWRLEDTDGDGVADEREELVTGLDSGGAGVDLHGPFLHPGGRLFWCQGRKGQAMRASSTGALVSPGHGARIWSCRVDGSDVQEFAGGGMDSPVEVDFTEEGEIIGAVNLFHARPRGDVLVHWQYGGAYPRRDRELALSEFKRTGPLLSEMHNFGHAELSGMTRYRSGHLNPKWKDSWLVAHFHAAKVTRTALEREGATFGVAATETIFEIQDPGAHLTDVLEEAGGDLLVVDTGRWFRSGCPDSEVNRPRIPGAIYRIRKAGESKKGLDPFGSRIQWETAEPAEIAGLLDADSFAVRERAMTELAVRGEAVLPEMEGLLADAGSSARARRNAVWTLTRIRFSASPDLIRSALADPDAGVRQAACEAVAATRNWQAVAAHTPGEARIEIERNAAIAEDLIERLRADAPPVQRAAAAALGRMAMAKAVGPLLGVAGRDTTDSALRHAVIYALIEIGDGEAIRPGLESENPRRALAALLALEGTAPDSLPVLAVLGFLESENEILQSAAIGIAARHPEWDGAVANLFHDWLDAGPLSETQIGLFCRLAPVYLGTPPMQSLVGYFLNSEDPRAVQAGFEVIREAVEVSFHESWQPAFEKNLQSGDSVAVSQVLAVLDKLGETRFEKVLAPVSGEESLPPILRARALRAAGKPDEALEKKHFDLLRSCLQPASSPAERMEAAGLLGGSVLSEAQLRELASLLRSAGPLEMPLLLRPFFRSEDAEVGRALAENLPASPSAGSVDIGELKRLVGRFPEGAIEGLPEWIAGLERAAGQRARKLEDLAPRLGKGNSEKGAELFWQGKGACVNCHRAGKRGGEIGPDLSVTGRIRTPRDLLESILLPCETVERSFEVFRVRSKGGSIREGVISREARDAIFLIDSTGKEAAIPWWKIEEIEPLSNSLMPEGLDLAMTEVEMIDLIEFLKNLTGGE